MVPYSCGLCHGPANIKGLQILTSYPIHMKSLLSEVGGQESNGQAERSIQELCRLLGRTATRLDLLPCLGKVRPELTTPLHDWPDAL